MAPISDEGRSDGVGTDLDAFLLDSKGKPLKVEVGSQEFFVGATDDNLSTQRPVEILQWENDTGSSAEVQLAIDDDGPPQPCASPFGVPEPLADGSHGIAVSGVDAAGHTGSSDVARFTIDTRRPRLG